MKVTPFLALIGLLALSACAHYDRVGADAVIPPPSDATGIEIVLPSAPSVPLEGSTAESVISFLRQNCEWIQAAGVASEIAQPTPPGYTIVIKRGDAPTQRVVVQGRELRCGAYRCRLSRRAAESLERRCGVEPVHLSPFKVAG